MRWIAVSCLLGQERMEWKDGWMVGGGRRQTLKEDQILSSLSSLSPPSLSKLGGGLSISLSLFFIFHFSFLHLLHCHFTPSACSHSGFPTTTAFYLPFLHMPLPASLPCSSTTFLPYLLPPACLPACHADSHSSLSSACLYMPVFPYIYHLPMPTFPIPYPHFRGEKEGKRKKKEMEDTFVSPLLWVLLVGQGRLGWRRHI